jgi:hypothetical protein
MYCSDVDWTELVQDWLHNMYFMLYNFGVYVLHVINTLIAMFAIVALFSEVHNELEETVEY